jgi:hypothetical protein
MFSNLARSSIFHRVEADGAKTQRLRDSLLDLMLVKVLHQAEHLNELAASAIAHSRFHQPPKTINAIGDAPVPCAAAYSSTGNRAQPGALIGPI